jgi:hypothetical protein
MVSKRNKKRLVAGAIAVAGLAGGGMAVYADTFGASVGVTAAPASWPAVTPTPGCSTDPCALSLDLHINTGNVTVQDVTNGGPVSVPFLGFGINTTSVGLAGSPLSTIKVPVGTTLTITVIDDAALPEAIDLSFPSLPADSVSHSGNVYTVQADTVGTSVFQPGANDHAPQEIARGLVGVLVVTPDSATCADPELKCAYDGTVYDDEALIAVTDLDLEFATNPNAFDAGYFGQSIDPDFSGRQVYHVINGKAFPDTDVIPVRATDDVLVRYVNAGVLDKAMGILGTRQQLLGRNASKYTDPQLLISPLIGPGETADVVVHVPDGALPGQFFSIMDSGRQLNNGTATGFGGALTFLNVRDGGASIQAVQALGVDTTLAETTTTVAETTTTVAETTTTTADTTTTTADTTTTVGDTTTTAAP